MHKISAVTTIAAFALTLRYFLKTAEIKGPYDIVIGAGGTLFLFAFITGVLLTFDLPARPLTLAVHRITPLLVTLSAMCAAFVFFAL